MEELNVIDKRDRKLYVTNKVLVAGVIDLKSKPIRVVGKTKVG